MACAAYNVPLLALTALGAWDRRRDGRALFLLVGPLLWLVALPLVLLLHPVLAALEWAAFCWRSAF